VVSLDLFLVTLPDGARYTTFTEPDLSRLPPEGRPRVDRLTTEVQRAETAVASTRRALVDVAAALGGGPGATLPQVLGEIQKLVQQNESFKRRLAERDQEIEELRDRGAARACTRQHEGDVVGGYLLKRVYWDETTGRRDTMG
jgi:hypothetical protein